MPLGGISETHPGGEMDLESTEILEHESGNARGSARGGVLAGCFLG